MEKGFSISEEIISNGTEVYLFNGASNNRVEGFEDGAYIKGTIVGHRLSENLSTDFRGVPWYEYIYSIVGENGKTYEATYGSALVGSFFIRTQKDFMKHLVREIKGNLVEVSELNRKNKELSKTLKSVITDEMKTGDEEVTYAPSKDSEFIGDLISIFEYETSKTNLGKYDSSEKSCETSKGLR